MGHVCNDGCVAVAPVIHGVPGPAPMAEPRDPTNATDPRRELVALSEGPRELLNAVQGVSGHQLKGTLMDR